MTTFSDLGLAPDLVHALASRGIEEPFPVQAATIPDSLSGRDVAGKAPTGSGKTIAFGAPVVERVQPARPRRPSALILAPTRELAAQITRELLPLAESRGQRVFSVYGGVGYEPQKRALRKGVEILVGCPGRLEDLIGQRALVLDRVSIVVIDEADRMADMGFLPAVRRLLDETNPERQTLLFSATLDGDVAVLTRDYQTNPARHEVEGVESDAADAEHRFERITNEGRMVRVAEVVEDEGPTIIFCRTRHGADKVAKKLSQSGVPAAPIHGGLSQAKRDRALADFTRGHVHALVATDVAARGIHVDDVACVVHFDPPEDAKTYVHRSGRTARKGATGVVVSLVLPDQVRDSRRMQAQLGLEVAAAPGERPARRPGPDRRPRERTREAAGESRPRRDGSGRDAAERPARRGGRDDGRRNEIRSERSRGDGTKAEGTRRGAPSGTPTGGRGGEHRGGQAARDGASRSSSSRDGASRTSNSSRDGAPRPSNKSGKSSQARRGSNGSGRTR